MPAAAQPLRARLVSLKDGNTNQGRSALKIRLSIDRFEGEKKQVAVLLTDDGTPVNFPRKLLPKGVKGGDILSLTIERDEAATQKVARETRAVQDELKKTDRGGDIRL
jgi:Protein of unknown function (DUF3006)